MHRLIRGIGDASARRPRAMIGVWAVAAALVMGLAGTAGGTFADDFVAPGSQSEEAMGLLEERFPEAVGGSAMAVFAAPAGGRLERHRPAVEAAVARIGEVEHAATVACWPRWLCWWSGSGRCWPRWSRSPHPGRGSRRPGRDRAAGRRDGRLQRRPRPSGR